MTGRFVAVGVFSLGELYQLAESDLPEDELCVFAQCLVFADEVVVEQTGVAQVEDGSPVFVEVAFVVRSVQTSDVLNELVERYVVRPLQRLVGRVGPHPHYFATEPLTKVIAVRVLEFITCNICIFFS